MHKKKILCITPIDHIPNIRNLLEKLGDLTVIDDPEPIDIKKISKDFNVIFTNPNKSKIFIGRELFYDWKKLECICTASTGTVHIEKEFLEEAGIELISLTTEYNVLKKISSTAELAFTLMLAALRNLIPANNSVNDGIWNYEPFVGRQINKLNICVFGFGRLGAMFANYCDAFGANVSVYDPYKDIPSKYRRIESLNDKYLQNINVLSIHMHVTEETKNFFNKSLLSKLKKDILLVNTARGELVDEDDLISFLKENKKAKIASDVLSGEIFGFKNSKLYQYSKISDQILLSPHIGGMTIDAQEIAYSHAANLLKKFIED